MIHTECYLAVLAKYRKLYPTAHFEVVTRSSGHVLSPSDKLLKKAKSEQWTFERYAVELLNEWSGDNSIQTTKALNKLKSYSTQVYLVCFEKDPSVCHRSIIKALLLGMKGIDILTNIQMNHDHLILAGDGLF